MSSPTKNKAQQYGGEHTLLYKKKIKCILNSLVNFDVDPRMYCKIFEIQLMNTSYVGDVMVKLVAKIFVNVNLNFLESFCKLGNFLIQWQNG